jgi:hypothetical protein
MVFAPLRVRVNRVKRVASVSAVLTVGFSHARCPSGNRASSIWMGHEGSLQLSVFSLQ